MAAATPAEALAIPNARSAVHNALSPALAMMSPFTCSGVKLGFTDSSSPAIPEMTGVAIEVPLNAS